MPLDGCTLIITSPLSAEEAVVYVDSSTFVAVAEDFDRLEYMNSKLRDARNACGQRRIIGENIWGKPYQVVSDCSDLTAVPLGPDSDANFENIKKRWDIKRYRIQGAMSENADVDLLYDIARNHQGQLAKFRYYLARASSPETPYESLYALRSETFSYLTTTGVDIDGTGLDEPIEDVLITSLDVDLQLSIALNAAGTSREYYKTFTMVFEKRILVTGNAITSTP